jgi:hypothetical protein
MAQHKRKEKKPDLEQLVNRAMREEGWLAPETEAEVLKAEITLERSAAPTWLDHPREFLNRVVRVRTSQLGHTKESSDVIENFARAAREGGKISSEIEERMKKDRDAAESSNKKR